LLGAQRALSAKIEDDPEKVSSFEPESTPALNWLMVVLGALMAALCWWLVLRDDVGIVARWIMVVGALFFSYGVVLIARRANKRRPVSFDSGGLWIDGPNSRKVIAWTNIESISRLSISSQQFNVIALKDVTKLIEQYEASEAKSAVNQENVVAMFGAAIGLSGGSAADLAAMFARRRTQFGGEVWITMYDRDRDAQAFEKLIIAWWNKHRKEE
jgi:hypothetical protein